MSIEQLSAVRFVVVAALPGGATQGDTLVLSGDGHLYTYNGSTWVDNGAAGGGGTVTAATITVPPITGSGRGRFEHYETLVDAGVTGSSDIRVWLRATTPDDENEAEMLDLVTLVGLPGTGTIDIIATFSQPTTGPIKINYTVT